MEDIKHIKGDAYVFTHRRYDSPISDEAFTGHHLHNEYELIFILEGDITYVLEDKKYKLQPYDMVLTRPSRYHYIQIDTDRPYERYNMLFPASFVGENILGMLPEGVEFFSCRDLPVVADNFRKAERYTELGPEAFGVLLSCLLKEICYNVVNPPESAKPIPDSVSPLVSSALDYINKNLYTVKNVEEISSALFVSENYFFRAFKSEMKISPKRYINHKRLLEAQRRISEGARPTDVYSDCGFASYPAFFKCYVKYFGHAPSKTEKT